MSALAAFHEAFVKCAETGQGDALAPFLREGGGSGGARVYRNNVVRALTAALASNYPAVRRLVGEQYFDSIAIAYAKERAPSMRTLVGYGAHFGAFVDRAAAATAAPYLGDIARLDRAWLEAHLAPEAPALSADHLARIEGETLARLAFQLHPSARCVRTAWAVYDVWAANREDGEEALRSRMVSREGEVVLIWRFDQEVRHRLLSRAESVFMGAIEKGETVGAAAEAAQASGKNTNVSAIFAGVLTAGVLTAAADNGEGVSG